MKTLIRNSIIAATGATIMAAISRKPSFWPIAFLLVLWPSLGGHFVELAYLRIFRPNLPANPPLQFLARICVWFTGGALLSIGMRFTSARFTVSWWTAGLFFIGLELLVHLVLQLRGEASLFNGRG